MAKSEPDSLQVAKATYRLQSALGWIGKKVDVAVDSFAKGVGGTAGKLAVAAIGAYAYPPLGNLITEIVKRVSEWPSYVTLPM